MRVVNINTIFILNLLDILMLLFYYNKSYKSAPNKVFQYIWNVLYLFVGTIENKEWDNQWCNLLIMLIFVLGNAFAFRESLHRQLVFGLAYVAVYLISEAVVGGILLAGFNMNERPSQFFTIYRNILMKLCMLLYIYVMTYKRKWDMRRIPYKIEIGLVLCIVGNILLSVSFTAVFRMCYPDDIPEELCIALIGLFFVMVFSYWLFDKLCLTYQELFEQQQLHYEYEQKEMHYLALEQAQKEIRKIKHDIKNQLLELNLQMACNNTCKKKEETLVLLQEIQQQLEHASDHVYTSCPVVDAILIEKCRNAQEVGIQVEHTINICGKLKMNRGDMGIILGNLLDNAIEAAEKEMEPKISIKMVQNREQLMIEIKNTCRPDEKIDWNSTKEDKQNHGIGIKSVTKVVEQYRGRLQLQQIQGMVIARVNLFGVWLEEENMGKHG